MAGLLLVALMGGSGWASNAPGDPTARVKAVLDEAMGIQTRSDLAGEAHGKERARLVRKLISESFLAEEMAREAVRDQWDKLSARQRTEFQGLFSELFQYSYTRMVLNFLQKETIDYKGATEEDKGLLVKTVILRANEHIPVDYHLVQKGGQWFIRDVDIDGVSIVGNYRDTFRRALAKSSFDELLKKMRLQQQSIGGDPAA